MQSVNTDLISEFHNNFRSLGDSLRYTTHMAKRDLDLTILQKILECRSLKCYFVCYPSFVEPFPKHFEHLSMNSIYENVYHGP